MKMKLVKFQYVVILSFLGLLLSCKRANSTNCLTSAQSDVGTRESGAQNTVFGKGTLIIWNDNSRNGLLDDIIAMKDSLKDKDEFAHEVALDALADQERITGAFSVPVHFAMTKTAQSYHIRVFGHYGLDNQLHKAIRIKLIVSLPQRSKDTLSGDQLTIAEAVFSNEENILHFDHQNRYSSAMVDFEDGTFEVLRFKVKEGFVYSKITGEAGLSLKLKDLYSQRNHKYLLSFNQDIAAVSNEDNKTLAMVSNEIYFPRYFDFYEEIVEETDNAWCDRSTNYHGEFPSDGLCSSFMQNHALDFSLSPVPRTEAEKEVEAQSGSIFEYDGEPSQENVVKADIIFRDLMTLNFRKEAELSHHPKNLEKYGSLSKSLEEKLMRNQALLNAIATNDLFLALPELYYFKAHCTDFTEEGSTFEYLSSSNEEMRIFCHNQEEVVDCLQVIAEVCYGFYLFFICSNRTNAKNQMLEYFHWAIE